MGFQHINHVKTTADAVRAVRSQATSFLITEWDMKGTSGVDLVRYLRRSNESPNRALPIVMLTGRGELNDVQVARDAGITEFVVKPFTSQTLFSRIEQVIDHPRSFVVSQSYVGPERRRRGLPPPGMEDRRTAKSPNAIAPTRDALKAGPGEAPLIFAPDYSIRNQLGTNKPLASLITPEVLKEAQRAIDALADDSLKWIREDLREMLGALEALNSFYTPQAFEKIKESALSIKARAGTFGYRMASDVARLLFLFLTTDFIPTNPRHLVVIQKHVQVLTVIFAQNIKLREGVGQELYLELEHLIEYHRH